MLGKTSFQKGLGMGNRLDFVFDLIERAIKRGIPRLYNFLGSGVSVLLSTDHVPFLPPVLFVEVTTKCNLHCFMCPHTFREYESKDMSLKDFESILVQLPMLNMLIPQGIGEPLLCEHIFSIIDLAKRQSVAVNFNTNGMLLTADRARALVESGLDFLDVSIDGTTEEVYQHIRGGGNLAKVVGHLKQMVELKRDLASRIPRLGIRTVVLKENISEIPKIVDLAASIGVTELAVQDLIGYDGVLEDSLIDAADYSKLLCYQREAGKKGVKMILENFSRFQKRKRRCVSPWVSPFITREGFVTPCCVITDPSVISFGNVFEKPFAEIWNGDEFTAFRADFKAGSVPVCRRCPRY